MSDSWIPHVTVATVVERDGEFLFVEEYSRGKLVINQPAGHVEFGESIVEAAVRETLEETGWLVEVTELLAVQRWHLPHSEDTFFRFALSAKTISYDENLELDEGIIRPVWMSPAEMTRRKIELRSPLVSATVEAYLSGKRYPLDLLQEY